MSSVSSPPYRLLPWPNNPSYRPRHRVFKAWSTINWKLSPSKSLRDTGNVPRPWSPLHLQSPSNPASKGKQLFRLSFGKHLTYTRLQASKSSPASIDQQQEDRAWTSNSFQCRPSVGSQCHSVYRRILSNMGLIFLPEPGRSVK